MNRREFTKSLMAAATLPALPVPAITAQAQAVLVPNAARFWAIYMTHLHGVFTPRMCAQMTGVDMATASSINAQLVAQNVITPAQAAGRAMAYAARVVHDTSSSSTHSAKSGIRGKLEEIWTESIEPDLDPITVQDFPETDDSCEVIKTPETD